MRNDVQNLKEEIIKELNGYNVKADITIEKLADIWVDRIQKIEGRKYVETFGICPICIDCPKNCSLDK